MGHFIDWVFLGSQIALLLSTDHQNYNNDRNICKTYEQLAIRHRKNMHAHTHTHTHTHTHGHLPVCLSVSHIPIAHHSTAMIALLTPYTYRHFMSQATFKWVVEAWRVTQSDRAHASFIAAMLTKLSLSQDNTSTSNALMSDCLVPRRLLTVQRSYQCHCHSWYMPTRQILSTHSCKYNINYSFTVQVILKNKT